MPLNWVVLKSLTTSFPYLRKKKLWGNHFWQRGYFVDSVGANEEIAERKLITFLNHLKIHRPSAFKKIQNILKDEEKHAEYSLRFAKNNNSFFLYKVKLAKEKILSFFRHLYANSLNKFSFIFNPILITILMFISLITHFLKLKKNITDEDVMKNIEPNSIT